jgi:hypothetical protein
MKIYIFGCIVKINSSKVTLKPEKCENAAKEYPGLI